MSLRIGQSRFTLLIIDDEPHVLAAFRRYLKNYPIELITVSCAKEAFNILEGKEIHVLLIDYRMPDINGIELCNILKERWPNTVRIILSGQIDLPKAQARVSPDLVFNFLVKPWHEREFLVELENAYEEWRLQNSLVELKGESEKIKTEEVEVKKRLEDIGILRSQGAILSKKILENKHKQLRFLLNIIKTLSSGIDKISFEKYLSKETQHLLRNNSEDILNEITPQIDLVLNSLDRRVCAVAVSSELASKIINPIRELKTFIELLEEEFSEEKFKNEFLGLREEYNQCYKTLQQTVQSSILNEPENHSAIDINEIVESALLPLSSIIGRSSISLMLNLTKELPQIVGDKEKLQKVVKNLIENALISLEDGGTLVVETKCDGRGYVYLIITDSGRGLHSTDLTKLFEPSSKTTSINLAASQAIIKKHRGNIFLSTKRGEGTRLTVSLPQAGGTA